MQLLLHYTLYYYQLYQLSFMQYHIIWYSLEAKLGRNINNTVHMLL